MKVIAGYNSGLDLTSPTEQKGCESNSKLWTSGLESDKEIARSRKRRLHYISNVLVLKDSENPENVGKVFLYQYGAKIFAKIMEALQPAFEDETPVDPFNLFKGANFKIKIKQVGGYWNYDSSEFDSPSALFDGDTDRLKKVFDSLHPIMEFVEPSKFKPYSELLSRFNEVLDIRSSGGNSYEIPFENASAQVPYVGKSTPSPEPTTSVDEDDDPDMEYFRKLAQSM